MVGMTKKKPAYKRGSYKKRAEDRLFGLPLPTTDPIGKRLYMRTFMAAKRSENRVRRYSPRTTRLPTPADLAVEMRKINEKMKEILKPKKRRGK